MQEKVVGTIHPDVFQVHVTAVPQRLLRVRNPHVLEPDTVHLAKHLRRLDQSVAHVQIARIPQRGAGSLRKKTFPYDEAVVMPERIFPLEATPHGLDVAALLERRLARMNGHVLQTEVARGEKRALASEFVSDNPFHLFIYFRFSIRNKRCGFGAVRTSSILRSACSSFRIHNPLCRTLPIRPPPPCRPYLSDRASITPPGRPPAIIASRKAPHSPSRRTAVLRCGASGTDRRSTSRRTDRNTTCAIPFVRTNVPRPSSRTGYSSQRISHPVVRPPQIRSPALTSKERQFQ